MPTILNGKELAEKIIDGIARQIIDENLEPQLAVVLVGDDPASQTYVRLKQKACKKVGILFHEYLISDAQPEEDILKTVAFLNNDPEIDAVLIQLPLPKKFNQKKILDAMDYRKDVDGFHRVNIQRYLEGAKQRILPGLSLAVWNLIAVVGEKNYLNKKALIIGKSEHFTKPTQKLLNDQGIQTEIAHPSDLDLKSKTVKSDIVISAIGKPKSITEEMIKDGAIVIDVGISKVDNAIVGDVDFKNVAPKCSYITPVPGGVGPMTVAMLLYNTVILARSRHTKS